MWYLLLLAPFSSVARHSKPCHGEYWHPRGSPELASSLRSHSSLSSLRKRTLFQHWTEGIIFSSCWIYHFIFQAPFSCSNHCWRPEVEQVHWHYLPGNLYLLLGEALFRALSNGRRETCLTPTQKTPPTHSPHQAYHKQRTLLARSVLRMQTSAWTLLGPGCRSSQGAKMILQQFCGVFCFCLHSSDRKFTQANIYSN